MYPHTMASLSRTEPARWGLLSPPPSISDSPEADPEAGAPRRLPSRAAASSLLATTSAPFVGPLFPAQHPSGLNKTLKREF